MSDLQKRVEETMQKVRVLYERTKRSDEDAREAWVEFPKYSYVMFSKIELLEADVKARTEREAELVEALQCIANLTNGRILNDYNMANDAVSKEGHEMKKSCSGKRISGYWKGYNCGAIAKYFKDGQWWCKNHLPLSPTSVEGESE